MTERVIDNPSLSHLMLPNHRLRRHHCVTDAGGQYVRIRIEDEIAIEFVVNGESGEVTQRRIWLDRNGDRFGSRMPT